MTDLPAADRPRLRLVLSGALVLDESLASPPLESLLARISTRCYLEAFSAEETPAYLAAMIRAGRCRAPAGFLRGGMPEDHDATAGVPCLVNRFSEHTLRWAARAAAARSA